VEIIFISCELCLVSDKTSALFDIYLLFGLILRANYTEKLSSCM